MKSRLTELHDDFNMNFYSWPLTSVRHWGETSVGTWTVTFADLRSGNTGRLISAALELIGTPLNPLAPADAGVHEVEGQANGNGVLDPGETVEQSVALHNAGTFTLTDLRAALSTTTPGVTLLQPNSDYPPLPPGGSATNTAAFVFRVGKNVPCGTGIQFTLISTTPSGRFTNSFTKVVGRLAEADRGTNLFDSADVPKAVPDLATVFSTNTIASARLRIVDDVNLSLRLDHTAVGDVQIALVHPDGSEVLVVDHEGGNNPNMGTGTWGAGEVRTVLDDEAATALNSGAAPFAGSYRPDNPLAVLRGKPLDGVWRLRLSGVRRRTRRLG